MGHLMFPVAPGGPQRDTFGANMLPLPLHRLSGICAAFLLVSPGLVQAQSQQEMNEEAAGEFERADAALNKIYKRFVKELDAEATGKLKAAQRAWVQFRDAESELAADIDARGGSMAPLIYFGKRTELTVTRAKELEAMLKPLDQ